MPNDPNPLVELLQKKWTWLAISTVVLILLWEVLKNVAPKGVLELFGFVKQVFSQRKRKAAQERSIRLTTAAAAEANWIGCLPYLAQQPVRASIETVYQPLVFRYQGSKSYDSQADIQRALTQDSSFAVVGPPGSGKSTMLSMLSRAYAKDSMEDDFQVKESRLPVLIPMRELREEPGILAEVLCEVLRRANCDVEPDFLKTQLEQGHCALLFDGLDETGNQQQRTRIAKWLKSAQLAYPKNRYVVSCRTNEWEAMPIPGFPVAHILPFDRAQRQALANRWLQVPPQQTANSGDQNGASTRTSTSATVRQRFELGSLASNPLMLTITIILSLRNIEIPKKRAALYLLFLRTLLGQWDRIKGTELGASDVEVEGRLRLFQCLAGYIAARDISRMSVSLSAESLAEMLHQARSPLSDSPDIISIVFELGERSGVLIRGSEVEEYTFANRALFEVLVARDLIERGQQQLALSRADDDVWFEIIVHVLELSHDVTSLLEGLKSESLLRGTRLRLLGCAIAETQTRGHSVQDATGSFSTALTEELRRGGCSPELCSLAWRIAPTYWKERMFHALQERGSDISKEQALKFLAASGTPDSIAILSEFAIKSDSQMKLEIAKVLNSSESDEGDSLLWLLAMDESAGGLATERLARRGKAVVETAISTLKGNTASLKEKEVSVRVLGATNDPEALGFLLTFVNQCEPRLHFVVLETLQSVQLKKFGREEALGVVDRVMQPKTFYAAYGKRALDIVGAACMLLLVLPIVLVLALLVRLSSPGPMIFRQDRVGKNGREFSLWKFRTMYADAENQTGPRWAADTDARVTLVGRYMRRLRLDELPQLFNVLLGDLSLVGPRPERRLYVDAVRERIPFFRELQRVTPGVTGLAQLEWGYGLSIGDIKEKVVFDLYYISHCSLWLDLLILMRTASRLLAGQGAK